MTAASATQPPLVFHPGPAVAGYLVPGLGHILIGEKKRGLIIMISLFSLFIAGLLIGGIDVINQREQKLWFAGQCLFSPIAPAIGHFQEMKYVEFERAAEQYMMQNNLQAKYIPSEARYRAMNEARLALLKADPSKLPYIRSVGRVNEIGTLYCAMAGLLNLLCILDVVVHPKRISNEPVRGKLVTREGTA